MEDPHKRRRPSRPVLPGDRLPFAVADLLAQAEADFKRAAAMQLLAGPSSEEIELYNSQLARYYESMAEHCGETVKHANTLRRTVELLLTLTNNGSAPARDVDIELRFPPFISLALRRRPPPPEPMPPEQPRGLLGSRWSQQVPWMSGLTPDPWRPPDPLEATKPQVVFLDEQTVRVAVGDVKHGVSVKLVPLYVTFHAHSLVTSIGVEYRLLVENLPTVVTGRLDVIASVANDLADHKA